jgi:subtilisin family serine protease
MNHSIPIRARQLACGLALAVVSTLSQAAPEVSRHVVLFERSLPGMEIADTLAGFPEARVERVWDTAINGALVTGLSASDAKVLARLPGVRSVAPDTVTILDRLPPQTLAKAVQLDPPHGLDRIDQRGPTLDQRYHYPDLSATRHVATVYVLDSGLLASHADFRVAPDARTTRAEFVFNAFANDPGIDDTGHGTHVAGIIAGNRYGVAKYAHVKGLRVCRQGLCPESALLSGLDWVARNHLAPAVVNLSIDLKFKSQAVADAINALHARGIFVVSAAGNSAVNTCADTQGVPYPANAATGNHVVAATESDRLWSRFGTGSGYGPCIFMSAPGVAIPSTAANGGSEARTGTSQATPHVAGVAALILQVAPKLSPDEVAQEILRRATGPLPNFWDGSLDVGHTTPNRLLYSLPN